MLVCQQNFFLPPRRKSNFQKSNFHFRLLSNKFEIRVKCSNLLIVTIQTQFALEIGR